MTSYTASNSSQRENKGDDTESDKQSTISQSSGVPRAEHALDALRLIAGNRVRHAHCSPEFLEEIASKGAHDGSKKPPPNNVKVICGQEARAFFRNYMSDFHTTTDDKTSSKGIPSPIAFAITVFAGQHKCVDYYMTWRGNKRASKYRDAERRIAFLDTEFRRLARKLDDEFKRIASLRTHGNLSPIRSTFDKGRSRKSQLPLGITISQPDDANDSAILEPPVSAADSVMSLPLLNMVRGVPLSHRVPLKVTNPDRFSMISEDPVQVLPSLEKFKNSKPPLVELYLPLTENYAPPSSRSKHGPEDSHKRSSDSVRSSDTKSSRSSRSSRSSSDLDHKGRQDDRGHDLDDELPTFLIVFLGDKLDADRDTSTTWHGLERQDSIRSLPADRHSPWIGPLAGPENPSLNYFASNLPADSDSDDSDDAQSWTRSTPVIPMKPLMELMGHAPSFYIPPPVVPGGRYVTGTTTGSPAPGQSPYLYSSPHLDATSYVPHWPPQRQSSTGSASAPNSRPPSRAFTNGSYASPYMQPHTRPF